MLSLKVPCPKCNSEVSLDDAIMSQVSAQIDELKVKDRDALMERARQDAVERVRVEIADMKAVLDEKTKQILDMETRELELRRLHRQIEEDQRRVTIDRERFFDCERRKLEVEIAERIESAATLRIAEKDTQLESMRRQIDELKRRSEPGSVQLRGEAQEVVIDAVLKDAFPGDLIEEIAKGVRGADICQQVRAPNGAVAGSILWESKRAACWKDSWISKLKEDQREKGCELAVLVTQTLPKGVSRFKCLNGIWVTDFQTFLEIAAMMRSYLLAIFQTKLVVDTNEGTKDTLHRYITSPAFHRRLETWIETIFALKEQSDREQRASQKNSAAREMILGKLQTSMVNFVGDLQGILGRSLPDIPHLELTPPQLETLPSPPLN